MRRFLSLISWGVGLTYAVPITAYVLLRGTPADAPWWLALVDTFSLYLFIPALPALLLALLSSSRPPLVLGLIPAVLFAFLYGGLFLPRDFKSTATGVTFTAMSHNVDARNPDPQRAAQVIFAANPDFLALQELTTTTAEALTARLSSQYQYRALLPRGDYSGVGLLSRFPIRTEESFTAGNLAQHLVLDVGGRNLHLFNVHFQAPRLRWIEGRSFPPYIIRDFDTERQNKQMAALMEKVSNVDGPILLMGDFNMTDQTRQYARITRNFTDVYRENGWGFGHTFPANGRLLRLPLPIIRIDYIFHSRELEGLQARVGDNTSSDHLPIIARLRLRNSN